MRIITHANCPDGFTSAYVFKKFWQFFVPNSTQDVIDNAEILPVLPKEIQTDFIATKNDVVLDLPRPQGRLLFWCDHHATNKQEKDREEDNWEVKPSNAGFLLEIAEKNGLKLSDALKEFKRACDIMDDAQYTVQDIKQLYYPQKSYEKPSALMKLQIISSMFGTRDANLNYEIFSTLLKNDLHETPLDDPDLWKLNPMMFYRSSLKSLQEWRNNLDTYVTYDEETKCVVEDTRLAEFKKGVFDRFYIYLKFPSAAYGLSLRLSDEDEARIGIGSNIFHKDRCKVDIGKLCKTVGNKFGSGSGGGHYNVGGCTVKADKLDDAKEFILQSLKHSQ